MKIFSLIILIILASQILTGCNAFNAGQNKQNTNLSSKGKDTCGRRHFKDFVGAPFDNIKSRGDFMVEYGEMDNGSGVWKRENRTYFLRVFDPRTILPGEDMVVTADYSQKRLNVSLNKDGIIKSLECG